MTQPPCSHPSEHTTVNGDVVECHDCGQRWMTEPEADARFPAGYRTMFPFQCPWSAL